MFLVLYLKFDFLQTKRANEVKWKTSFPVWQVLLFRLQKLTSKNVTDKTFKSKKYVKQQSWFHQYVSKGRR